MALRFVPRHIIIMIFNVNVGVFKCAVMKLKGFYDGQSADSGTDADKWFSC